MLQRASAARTKAQLHSSLALRNGCPQRLELRCALEWLSLKMPPRKPTQTLASTAQEESVSTHAEYVVSRTGLTVECAPDFMM